MGTRNITSVILHGKQVVCQYGQWDGYPTYAGSKILKFLRDADREHLKNALENTSIKVTDYAQAVSYTGSTKDYSSFANQVMDAKRALNDATGKWPDFEEVFQYLLQQGNIAADDLENYFVWTRDTGCDILPLIYNRSLDKPPLELAAMTHEFNGDYAWDIQGVYIINLDDNTVKMTFDEYSCGFDLDHLPESIEFTMLVFETATEALYEYKLDHPSFLSELQNSDAGKTNPELRALAGEITSMIVSRLEEDNMGLSFEEQASDRGKQIIQEFVQDILREKMGRENISLSSKISLAEAKAAEQGTVSNEKGQHLER